ncbi:MAG: FkbM family methyltransferase [Verrucomicrobia bacterium]|nr:FkbM family methyltransferase [Verrucomicrobiota bacterium]
MSRLGGHLRDLLIGAFPLEMRTARGLTVRLRNRSELSVYRNIFVERVYPFEPHRSRLGSAESPVVFDVGANTGLFAAAVFDHWPKAQVHSFEPQPRLIPKLREIAALNGLEERHFVNWCAIAGSAGEAKFYQNRNPISASLIQEKAARRSIRHVDRVAVTTLDAYAESRGIRRVDLLKLDVEGVELDALRGAPNVLGTVRLLFIEVHPPFSTFSAASELLGQAGLISVAGGPPPDDTAQVNAVFCRRE